ncbi:hypothetical protein KAR91_28415 [Candidatus Pacearchaeota archaeon]|nr:hypothetical protein [Candidatus Pacearchaeota archaeon]
MCAKSIGDFMEMGKPDEITDVHSNRGSICGLTLFPECLTAEAVKRNFEDNQNEKK